MTKRGRDKGDLWRQVSAAMTKGLGIRPVALGSLLFAATATLLTVPYFYFLLFRSPGSLALHSQPLQYDMLYAQTALLFIICLLCAMAGFSFSKRLGLPGFGTTDRLHHFLALGAVLLLLSLVLFDRYFYPVAPWAYPKQGGYLFLIPFKEAVADELILRFGLVTIAVGIARSRIIGVGLVSAFATMLSVKYFRFIGVDIDWSYVFIIHFILVFSINFILGYVYVTRGLISVMAVKWILGFRYALLALTGG